MKIIAENNEFCLKFKKMKTEKSQLAIFCFSLYSLSQVFDDMNDN